jgi:hypothetical protein
METFTAMPSCRMSCIYFVERLVDLSMSTRTLRACTDREGTRLRARDRRDTDVSTRLCIRKLNDGNLYSFCFLCEFVYFFPTQMNGCDIAEYISNIDEFELKKSIIEPFMKAYHLHSCRFGTSWGRTKGALSGWGSRCP